MTHARSEEFNGGRVPGAIVLGGNFLGLGIVRSLGSRGIPVWLIDTDRSKSIAQYSRYTKRFIASTEPVNELLLREARQHDLQGWVIFATNDDYVEVVATFHERLSTCFRVTTPPLAVTNFALDKRLTYRKAAELSIAAPWTWVGNSLAGLSEKEIPFPVILKPAVNHHFFPQTNLKALPADNWQELQRGFAHMSNYIPPDEILVQERIPGSGENQFSFCGICQDGLVGAWLVAQRRRQYPIEFGNASTFVETVSQEIVEACGRRFLENVGFDGMAEVEFKFDVRDGKYKILDVNARPWGWHTLGKAAGIDFPYTLWRQRVGMPPLSAEPRRDAAWMREITDLVAILKSRDRGAELKRLWNALRDRKFTFATFRFSDPVPFFAELALFVASGLSRQKKAKEFLRLSPAPPRPSSAGSVKR